MADLIIREKDIKNLGKKTIKEVYYFLNDDYILKDYDFLKDDYMLKSFVEMEKEKEKLNNILFDCFLKMIYNITDSDDYTKKQYENYIKHLDNKINYNIILNKMISKIEDESLEIETIYKILENISLKFKINKDLFVKKKAFIYLYTTYYLYANYSYLED